MPYVEYSEPKPGVYVVETRTRILGVHFSEEKAQAQVRQVTRKRKTPKTARASRR